MTHYTRDHFSVHVTNSLTGARQQGYEIDQAGAEHLALDWLMACPVGSTAQIMHTEPSLDDVAWPHITTTALFKRVMGGWEAVA